MMKARLVPLYFDPGRDSDVYGISIDCTAVGGDAWTFGEESLDAGNLQIHSGIKD